jgi:hypothetical protein
MDAYARQMAVGSCKDACKSQGGKMSVCQTDCMRNPSAYQTRGRRRGGAYHPVSRRGGSRRGGRCSRCCTCSKCKKKHRPTRRKKRSTRRRR